MATARGRRTSEATFDSTAAMCGDCLSQEVFGAPIPIDRNRKIIAGHGRYEAAKLLACAQVPVIFLDHLSETQARAIEPNVSARSVAHDFGDTIAPHQVCQAP